MSPVLPRAKLTRAGLGILLFLAPFSSEALPRLKARLQITGSVRLEFKIAEIRQRNTRDLKFNLMRARAGEKFKKIASYRGARRRVVFTDTPGQGQFKYRGILKRRNRALFISKAVKVTISESIANAPAEQIETPVNTLAAHIPCDQAEIDSFSTTLAQLRIEAGSAALTAHPILEFAAWQHAINMRDKQILTHDGWFNLIWDAGFRGTHMSQNVAKYIRSGNDLALAFMSSQYHKENMINPGDTFVGIACVLDDNNIPWWAINFGR